MARKFLRGICVYASHIQLAIATCPSDCTPVSLRCIVIVVNQVQKYNIATQFMLLK